MPGHATSVRCTSAGCCGRRLGVDGRARAVADGDRARRALGRPPCQPCRSSTSWRAAHADLRRRWLDVATPSSPRVSSQCWRPAAASLDCSLPTRQRSASLADHDRAATTCRTWTTGRRAGRWKRRELLRIAARDLVGDADLVVDRPPPWPRWRPTCSPARWPASSASSRPGRHRMGKLGARELNYASDVDVMFVGDGDPTSSSAPPGACWRSPGRCFRVDANLRPEGRDGPLVRTLASYEAYWERWAEPWEFQALLKARPVAGDPALGDRLAFGGRGASSGAGRSAPTTCARSASMKERAEAAGRARGPRRAGDQAGPGRHPRHRVLGAAAAAGARAGRSAAARAGHAPMPRRAGRRRLRRRRRRRRPSPTPTGSCDGRAPAPARRRAAGPHRSRRRRPRAGWPGCSGYTGEPEAGADRGVRRDLAAARSGVRAIHERLWFRPLLEAFAGARHARPEAAADRLAAFGFTDVERTRQAVRELTRGLTRSSRLMQQLLPLLLDWLSASPDPDLGLLGLRKLATGQQRSMAAGHRVPRLARGRPAAVRCSSARAGCSARSSRQPRPRSPRLPDADAPR